MTCWIARAKRSTRPLVRNREQRISALHQTIADSHTKSKKLLRTLEIADDVDQEMVRDINERRAELKAERAALEAQLAEAEQGAQQLVNPDLLHRLPIGHVDIDALPDEMSRRCSKLFVWRSATTRVPRGATCQVTLIGGTIDAVARTIRASNVISPTSTSNSEKDNAMHVQMHRPVPALDGLRGAPGRTRTCDPKLRRLLLSPLSYEGMRRPSAETGRCPRGLIVRGGSGVSCCD
jgi:hypothetical protein